MHTRIQIIMAAACISALCGCKSTASSSSPSAVPSVSPSSSAAAVSPTPAPSAFPSQTAVSSSLIKSWSSKEVADGGTHVLSTPVITDVSASDDQITIQWQPVTNASQYDISWGRADFLTSDPSFTFSTDESTWPNDMVGSDPIHIHIGATNDQNQDSAYTDVEIQASTGAITFAFYDYDNKDVKVGQASVDTSFPAGVQTFTVYDNTVCVGPLQVTQAPDGWSFRGSFSFATEPIQPDQNNTVSIFVIKQ